MRKETRWSETSKSETHSLAWHGTVAFERQLKAIVFSLVCLISLFLSGCFKPPPQPIELPLSPQTEWARMKEGGINPPEIVYWRSPRHPNCAIASYVLASAPGSELEGFENAIKLCRQSFRDAYKTGKLDANIAYIAVILETPKPSAGVVLSRDTVLGEGDFRKALKLAKIYHNELLSSGMEKVNIEGVETFVQVTIAPFVSQELGSK